MRQYSHRHRSDAWIAVAVAVFAVLFLAVFLIWQPNFMSGKTTEQTTEVITSTDVPEKTAEISAAATSETPMDTPAADEDTAETDSDDEDEIVVPDANEVPAETSAAAEEVPAKVYSAESNDEPADTTAAAEENTAEEISAEVYAAGSNDEPAYTFRDDDLLEEHYEKHGEEMGFANAEEYEAAAAAVIENPDALYKTEAEDGDGVYYVTATNEFVILSTDGYIRTYFLPDDGIDYFNRQ